MYLFGRIIQMCMEYNEVYRIWGGFMEDKIGKLLGSGGTSNVYEWGDAYVIKIYKPHVEDSVIDNEKNIGELLNRCSLSIPKLVGSIHIEGKLALIYERVEGEIYAKPLLDGHYEQRLAYSYARMHYELHKNIITELPSLHEMLKYRILSLSEKLEDKREGKTASLLRLLENIPHGQTLCHGDFQPLNIIGDDNEYRVIDWNGACSGNPIFDVAWSYMTLLSPVVDHLLSESVAKVFREFNEDYLHNYCDLSGIHKQQIIDCLPIVAARRLYDNVFNGNETSKLELDWLYRLVEREVL
jgi:thiamine kinase-like enzyme